MSRSEGIITLRLENVSYEEVDRVRRVVHELITNGVLTLKNGKAVIYFDHNAELSRIDFDYVKWKRDKKPLDFANHLKNAKVEIEP